MQSSISYTLGANVENLTLTGSGNINGTGNALANVITGNSGNNTLDGGAGADTMVGGAGNDTYVVDNAGDVVTETADEGTDTVQTSISYTLGANVENLTLTGSGQHQRHRQRPRQHDHRQQRHNMLRRRRQRHAGRRPGRRHDVGGAGNDTYVVDNAGDVVTEAPNEGTDTVQRVGHLHADRQCREPDADRQRGNINGTGNGLANVITGNSGDNTLDGGAGADTMIGGLGNDTYVVDNTGDVVTEAQRGHRHGAALGRPTRSAPSREPDADGHRHRATTPTWSTTPATW